MAKKSLSLWIAALTCIAGTLASPARADTWPQWRFDPSNTGFNSRESLLIPIPDLFWFSDDISAELSGAIKTYGPIVLDIKQPQDVVPDHVIILGRRDRIYAYRPGTQGSGAQGSFSTVQGWPFNLARIDDTNTPSDNASGLIQAPPIFARVSGFNQANNVVETRDVIYVVTGTGVGQDFVMVHAISVNRTNALEVVPERLWTHKVVGRLGGVVKLAGVTFADIGDSTNPIPLLFLTTQEGRLHAINARPFDSAATGSAGSPRRGEDRWVYTLPVPTGGTRPTFTAAPAVGRAALTGFPTNLQATIAVKHREWLVVATDTSGTVTALEAFGKTASINVDLNGKPANTDAPTGVRSATDTGELVRWRFSLDTVAGGAADAVSVPPMIWNGQTPIVDSAAEDPNRTPDQGHDDLVLVATHSGKVYALDFLGNFLGKDTGTAKAGDAAGTTFRRWLYPDPDLPAAQTDTTDQLSFAPKAIASPMAAWAGVTLVDEDGGVSTNTSPEDDAAYVRWDEPDATPPAVREAVGAIAMYPHIETAQPMDATVTPLLFVMRPPAAGGAAVPIPVPAANFVVNPKFQDTSDDTDADRNGTPDNQPFYGRIVVIKQSWLDINGDPQELRIGDQVRVTYRPEGATANRTEDNLPFPCRRRPASDNNPNSPDGSPLRMSIGIAGRTIQDLIGEVITPPTTGTLAPAPPMVVANNHIWLGSRYRGRFYMLRAEAFYYKSNIAITSTTPTALTGPTLANVGSLISSDDPQAETPPEDDLPGIPDPTGAPAVVDGWLYVAYESSLLASYANDGGLTPGTGSGLPDQTNFPFRRRFPQGNRLTKPDVLIVDGAGNPIVDEEKLVFDWGETITIKVNFLNSAGDRFGLSRNPVRATLRGPMGDLPPVTASPVLPANAANLASREALLQLQIPNASSQNPMTPGTNLLKDTPMPQRGTEPHWEIRVEQIGTNWAGTPPTVPPSDPGYIAEGPWVPNTARNTWEGDAKSSPWITLSNPIALGYAPLQGVTADIGAVERFATAAPSRRDERFNGDPYKSPGDALIAPGGGKFDDPAVITVGTDPRNGRQLLYADHGKTSPSMQLVVYDRSDLGVNGTLGPLRVKVTVAKITKLGMGQVLATGNTSAMGSVNQNANFPDDGADGYYPSIPGDRLKVVKIGDGSDATDAAVPLRGAATTRDNNGRPTLGADGRATKALQPDFFAVSVEVPRFQPDDVYSTRARVPQIVNGAPVFTAQTRVDPRQTFSDFIGTTGQPSNAPPPEDVRIRDDKSARVTVFVDANNNGRLDLQGNFREAYRTFAVQVAVRPEFKMEVRERTVDLGLLWHGFESPPFSTVFGTNTPTSTAYRNYWKPFTLVNTGNVNLPYVKPEVMLSRRPNVNAPEQFNGMITLGSDGVDSIRSLTLVRNPNDPGSDLRNPQNVYLRTSLDDLLLQGTNPYGQGQGAWLQKARAGSSAPSTNVFPADPSVPVSGQPVPTRLTYLTLHLPVGTPLGTYSGSVRFFNDQNVQMQIATAAAAPFPGFAYSLSGRPNNGQLDRLMPAELPEEPFTDPTFALKVRVSENLAAGSVTDPTVRGTTTGTLSRTTPAAGMNRLDLVDSSLANFPDRNPIALFYATNQAGLPANPLQFDLFGATMTFNQPLGIFPFDGIPQDPAPWTALGTGPISGTTARPGMTIKNTKPSFTQDDVTAPGSPRAGFLFWHQEATSQPGRTDSVLMYRQITPNPGDPKPLTPGGLTAPSGTLNRRMAPRAVVTVPATGTSPNWLVFWHGGDAQKRNLFFSQSTQPADEKTWSAEKVLATSSSLASVGDPSPSYSRPTPDGRGTGALWMFYSGLSQRLGRTDVYLTKYDPRNLGNPNAFFGMLGLSPVTADVLTPNANRTVFTAGAIDWVVNRDNPVQVYLDDIALIQPGDAGARSATGEIVYEVRQGTPPLPNEPGGVAAGLQALRTAGVRVIIDPAGGVVRFSMDARRMRSMMTGLPVPTQPGPPPDPEISADYVPGTLRVTRGDAGASGPFGLITNTWEPSWLYEVLDLQGQVQSWNAQQPKPEARAVRARGDRMWVFWRRSAGAVGGGPALYFKTLRPAIKVRRGRFINLNITVVSRPDAVGAPGNATPIPVQDIDMSEGALYFREEDEGLVGPQHPYGGRPVPVDVTYTDPVTTTQLTERHYITWREELGETPVPLDVSVNEGSLSVFPVYERVMMQTSPAGPLALTDHVQKLWLFWSSTRGSGNDIFHATLAPRFKQDAQLLDPRFGITTIRGKR